LRFTLTERQHIHRLHPNAPTNLTASGTTANATTLEWPDVVGASGYKVYQDGEVIASPVTSTYNVSGLTTATEYEFFVTATDSIDDADNESGPSNTVTVITL
jgi:hypothetical protein